MTPAERLFKERVERVFPERRVIISRGLFARRPPEKGEALSRISSPATTLRAAQDTGRLTLRSGAVVARVMVEPGRKPGHGRGVGGRARPGGPRSARAKVVFLCASTLESVRILMNSPERRASGGHRRGVGRAGPPRDGPQRRQRLLLPAGRAGRPAARSSCWAATAS